MLLQMMLSDLFFISLEEDGQSLGEELLLTVTERLHSRPSHHFIFQLGYPKQGSKRLDSLWDEGVCPLASRIAGAFGLPSFQLEFNLKPT